MTCADTAASGPAYSNSTGVLNATKSCTETVTTYTNSIANVTTNTYTFNCYLLNGLSTIGG